MNPFVPYNSKAPGSGMLPPLVDSPSEEMREGGRWVFGKDAQREGLDQSLLICSLAGV